MNTTVIAVAGLYFAISLGVGFFVGRKEKNVSEDYFLAGRKLPWYAVSMSLTGSNIGTEHFVGMVGTAYVFGMAPATFEWCNFIAFSYLAFISLPYFFRKKLYTVPEFLEKRYAPSTRAVFAVLSLLHMVLGVLTPALYAGGRILHELVFAQQVTTLSPSFVGCVMLIAAVTAAYCIYGGLLSVVWTDVLQVIILVAGGILLVTVGVREAGGLSAVLEANNAASGARMSLIHEASHPVSPWTGVATIWLTLSLWYVATNQFYMQRCLGARSEWDSKMGVIGAAFIKFFLPFIIVFPGLVAFTMYGVGVEEDAVYVRMINDLLPPAGQGLLLAALIAAIMSTVSSVLNSSSTIWAMDIHKRLLHRDASEAELVRVGRWSTFVVICIGTVLAPALLFWKGGIFIYIQDMAAFFAPPISAIFVAAFFWKRAHGNAATVTLIAGLVAGIAIKTTSMVFDLEWLSPLLMRAFVNWVICAVVLVGASYAMPQARYADFDRDILWRFSWARLPEEERRTKGPLQSLLLWWGVMVALSISLFVIFR